MSVRNAWYGDMINPKSQYLAYKFLQVPIGWFAKQCFDKLGYLDV